MTAGVLLPRFIGHRVLHGEPVFGGACEICPWGAMAEVVKAAMQPYGYDVQICYNCNGADRRRLSRPDPAVPEILAPRNAPGWAPWTSARWPSNFCATPTGGRAPTRKTNPGRICA